MANMVNPETCNTAVIFAAGDGTRALPNSKWEPKEMSDIGGVPLLGLAVAELRLAGIENLVLVGNAALDHNGNNYQQVLWRRWFDDNERYAEKLAKDPRKAHLVEHVIGQGAGLTIEYVIQPDDGEYGTEKALRVAKPALKGVKRFFVTSGDDLLNCQPGESATKDVIEATTAAGTEHGMMGVPIDPDALEVNAIFLDENHNMAKFVEGFPASELGDSEILGNPSKYDFRDSIWDVSDVYNDPSYTRPQEEFYIIDLLNMAVAAGERIHVHKELREYLDTGSADKRLIANLITKGVPLDLLEKVKQYI